MTIEELKDLYIAKKSAVDTLLKECREIEREIYRLQNEYHDGELVEIDGKLGTIRRDGPVSVFYPNPNQDGSTPDKIYIKDRKKRGKEEKANEGLEVRRT